MAKRCVRPTAKPQVVSRMNANMNQDLQRFMALVDVGRNHEVEEWARPRAEKGEADGQFLLGYLVFGSEDVDFRIACEWLHRAADQDHAEALFALSEIDESMSSFQTGLPNTEAQRSMLRRAAEIGSIRAQRDLGCYLAIGEGGFVQDEAEARLWYGRAAQSGHVDAQYNFGLMCLNGEGGPSSPVEAAAWLERAAASDPKEPMVSCAVEVLLDLYERGAPGLPANPQSANAMRARLEEVLRLGDG